MLKTKDFLKHILKLKIQDMLSCAGSPKILTFSWNLDHVLIGSRINAPFVYGHTTTIIYNHIRKALTGGKRS